MTFKTFEFVVNGVVFGLMLIAGILMIYIMSIIISSPNEPRPVPLVSETKPYETTTYQNHEYIRFYYNDPMIHSASCNGCIKAEK